RHPIDLDSFGTEAAEHSLACLALTRRAQQGKVHSQIDEIVRCVRATPRNDFLFPLLQDQHRSLARDSSDLSVHKFVGNKVAEHDYALAGNRSDDVPEASAIRGVESHQIVSRRHLNTSP